MVYVYLVTPSTLTILTSALGLVTPRSTPLVLARYGISSVCSSVYNLVCLYTCVGDNAYVYVCHIIVHLLSLYH